jgi:tetrahydromethanopterin S-methyltransferase subunit G
VTARARKRARSRASAIERGGEGAPPKCTMKEAVLTTCTVRVAQYPCVVERGKAQRACYNSPHMSESDFERLSRLMLDEFGRVHQRFDGMDNRFNEMDGHFSELRSEVVDIHRRLDTLEQTVTNTLGFAKEIDHLLLRINQIEKHLGLQPNI